MIAVKRNQSTITGLIRTPSNNFQMNIQPVTSMFAESMWERHPAANGGSNPTD